MRDDQNTLSEETPVARDVYEILKSAGRLPSPPAVAMRILELTRSEETSLADIADAISSDPALSACVLKFINSPISGISREVSSLNQAVTLIGMRGVKMIALSFSLVSSEVKTSCPSFDHDRFWSQSLACGVAARAIARKTNSHDTGEAFTAGLLARIGQVALATGMPDEYERVLQMAARQSCTSIEAESEILGTTHIEIGARLLEEWQLPETIWRSIGQYRSPAVASDGEGIISLAQILHTANLAASIMYDSNRLSPDKVEELLRIAEVFFSLDKCAWISLYEDIAQEWQEYGQVFDIDAAEVKSFEEIQAEAQQKMAEISLATQVENQMLTERNEELLHESSTDKLTDVGNRASFDERLAVELARAKGTGRPLALFLVDVDHFKGFNDTYGHEAGDLVLLTIERSNKLRVLGRYSYA